MMQGLPVGGGVAKMPGVRGSSIVIVALALAGCEKADNAPGPGGITMGEARALDDAAKMLDARRPPANLLRPSPSRWPSDQRSEGADAADR